MKDRPPTNWRIRPFYCVRELEDGTRCSHHLDVHQSGKACGGMGSYGEPCSCRGFRPAEEDQRPAPR